MNVTFRQLRAFVHVAELGTFVDAARSIHVTASALSIVVAELEKTLGFRVFDRTTRRVRLSTQGEEYLPYARRVLQDLESAQRCAEALRDQKTGIVRLATSQLIAWTLMPAAFAAFREFRPDIRVEPMDLAVDEILPSLDAGRVDLAITLAAPSDFDLQTRVLFDSRVHVACGPSHPWAKRKSLRWRDLRDEPLIFTGIDTPQRINAALPEGPQLEAAWHVEHTATALGLVASGFGSAICAGYVEPLLQMHKLHKVPLMDPVVTREFALFTSRRRGSTPAMDALSEFLQQFFSKAAFRRSL